MLPEEVKSDETLISFCTLLQQFHNIGKKAIGIIDFHTLHPGPKLWDISYSLYRWIPLMSLDNPENFGSEEDEHRRLDLFIKTFGLKDYDDKEVIKYVLQRLDLLVSFMEHEAENGNMTFKRHSIVIMKDNKNKNNT